MANSSDSAVPITRKIATTILLIFNVLPKIFMIIGTVTYNTYQVKDYDRYELAGFSEEAKRHWRDAHWEEDLQKAYDAGRKMANC